MNPLIDLPEIKQFLQQACGAMKTGRLREEIRLELENHLEEAVEEERAAGVSEQEAAVSAVRRMGDPVTLGKSLWSIHKPRLDLTLLWPMVLMIGLASLFAVQVIWNLGMSFGLLPIMGVSLPFLSYGPVQLFFQLLMMGIMLSVSRRRTMLGSGQGAVS
ncbi:MAG: permease prefix domain 1-containing protein [Gorillibacterium sp.]|nr:permease prefix domain 1-containing protein [Gorillibacterium sp.]